MFRALTSSRIYTAASSSVHRMDKKSFHRSTALLGFEEFFDEKKNQNDTVFVGRGWRVPELRRKSFDDLHKLWYVLYKERNLLLTDRERVRRLSQPITRQMETRYAKVKRAMGGIKLVLNEREQIYKRVGVFKRKYPPNPNNPDDPMYKEQEPASGGSNI